MVTVYQLTWCNNPDNLILHQHTPEIHKYHKHILCWQICVMFLLYQPGKSVHCQVLNSNNPCLYLCLAASQYLTTVTCFTHPILHYITDYRNVFITYRRRLSKARPSTSSMGMVVSCEAMGPCNIARNTELASARTALLPGKRHCSGPTRKMTSLPASLSNTKFHLSRQNTKVALQI